MKSELKTMTRKQLERLRADIDKALERLAVNEKKEALKAAEKAAKAHGYSLAELASVKSVGVDKPKKVKRDGRSNVAPKYKNLHNPELTWTGRGRKPKWVEAHLTDGGALEDLLI